MSDLSGYETGVAYPSQFKAATTPGYIAGALALQGWIPPRLDRPFRFVDLGCGDGLTAALVAASHPIAEVEGIDGMAEQIEAGRAFPSLPANLTLKADSFSQCAEDTRNCDFITAQGVIAWVAPEVREQVFDIAAQRLRQGGVFAVSYNTLPGWASRLGLQRLLLGLAPEDKSDPVAAFDKALERLVDLATTKALPAVAEHVASLQAQRAVFHPSYFPHEYFALHWRPLWSTEVRIAMAQRGLVYVGQAGFSRLRQELTLKRIQRDALLDCKDATADAMIDLFHNTSFRIDLYMRDPTRSEDAGGTWLLSERTADGPLEAVGPAGRLRFDNPATREALTGLADAPAQLSDLISKSSLGAADVQRALDCLLIGGQVRPCAPPTKDTNAILNLNLSLSDAASKDAAPLHGLAGRYGPVAATKQEMVAFASGEVDPGLKRRGVENLAN